MASVHLKEKFSTKWYTTLGIYVKPIVKNRVAKLRFAQKKN